MRSIASLCQYNERASIEQLHDQARAIAYAENELRLARHRVLRQMQQHVDAHAELQARWPVNAERDALLGG